MLFNSVDFFLFFPIVLLICFVLPKKIRYLWLLVCSYYFYMNWNYKFIFLLLFTTIITYCSALLLERCDKLEDEKKRERRKKLVMWTGVILNLGLLCYFKYMMFFLENLGIAFKNLGFSFKVPHWEIILPVGISFFIFQAISYLIDVYRGDIYVEKNFFRYALFVSFFPQLVAGPIERSKNLLKQLATPPVFCYENIRAGFWQMMYGFFLKMVLADRAAIYVDRVYANYQEFQGFYLVVAAILFSFQLYCDFYGYSVIAMGAARMMGYRLIDNFRAPFYATSVEEFWRRWHISLNGWFRDYLYIP
ncbi:MAG: MBOAT family protein, partial [Lachnospiraceae bacterium]|nr:MBOAT family protein [Lachnospiraceae bacterium]